jgi:hypothetical protein
MSLGWINLAPEKVKKRSLVDYNEVSGFIIWKKCLNQMSDYQLLKNDSGSRASHQNVIFRVITIFIRNIFVNNDQWIWN